MAYWDRRLTRFELARVLGARALQISLGAPVLVKTSGKEFALEIAKRELMDGKVPMVVIRRYPDGVMERIELNEKDALQSAKDFF